MQHVNFEHLIQINDPNNPLLAELTRAQIWRGLWARVENPMPFLPGLEGCRLLRRDAQSIDRELSFGQAVIHDRATFENEAWVRFEVSATPQHPGGSLTITIEEPETGVFFLRFAYVTSLSDEGDEARKYAEFVKSAYRESDIDMVHIIRAMCDSEASTSN